MFIFSAPVIFFLLSMQHPISSKEMFGLKEKADHIVAGEEINPTDWDDILEEESGRNLIVGGENAPIGAHPFMVAILDSDDKILCGGSLIHDDLVLTAAHCKLHPFNVVRIGGDSLYDFGGITRTIAQAIRHPDYDDVTLDYDFMILKLFSAVDTTEYQPIELNSNAQVPEENEMLTVIGFGAINGLYLTDNSQGKLKEVNVPTISDSTCHDEWNADHDIFFCAGVHGVYDVRNGEGDFYGAKDACSGDSGGPIFRVINGIKTQVGVVSFGDSSCSGRGVYARVSGVYDWIQSLICELTTVNRPTSCPVDCPLLPDVICDDTILCSRRGCGSLSEADCAKWAARSDNCGTAFSFDVTSSRSRCQCCAPGATFYKEAGGRPHYDLIGCQGVSWLKTRPLTPPTPRPTRGRRPRPTRGPTSSPTPAPSASENI